jgi:hypothetical protein
MRNSSLLKKVGLLSVLCACTSTAWAHHGGGTFDPNKCFVFKGTVRKVAWVNPHAWIYVEVPKSGTTQELWGFEFGSVSGLARSGFRPADFPTGTKVTITAYANRAIEKHTASSNKLVLADGRVVGGPDASGTAPGSSPPPGVAPAGGPPGAGAPPTPPGGGYAAKPTTNCPDYK